LVSHDDEDQGRICPFRCPCIDRVNSCPAEVYRWLAADKDSYGILEYPFETEQINNEYMYWSTFQGKKLANGSTGYIPKKIPGDTKSRSPQRRISQS
jgi:hypothetical protein